MGVIFHLSPLCYLTFQSAFDSRLMSLIKFINICFFQKIHAEELEAEREKSKEAIAAAVEEERKRSKVCESIVIVNLEAQSRSLSS